MDTSAATLHACLDEWAVRSPDRPALTFLDGKGDIQDALTFGEWRRRALIVGDRLRGSSPPGSRILLLFEPGLDFAVALFGCFMSGHVAVPAYPPDPVRLDRTMPRFLSMVQDAGIVTVLASRAIVDMTRQFANSAPGMDRLNWLPMPADPDARPAETFLDEGVVDGDALALIQYTSGSTGRPKGVTLSHANIIENMRMMQAVSHLDQGRTIMSWLPVYHDLGLAVALFLPVVCGSHSYQMATGDFLREPATWLRAIDRYRITDTAVPSFALDLVVRKMSRTVSLSLDLSCLRICLVGADVVNRASVQRFTDTFAAHGLARGAMLPAYGLAEAVVGVACLPSAMGMRSVRADRAAMMLGRFIPDPGSGPSSDIVSMGRPLPGVDLRIVGPSSLEPLAEDAVGEVWIRAANVARGYFRRGEAGVFDNVLEGEGGWLRTGDLGFIHDGDLYISGRSKDLIVIRGRNHYPQDIEATVERAHPSIRPGATIAFSAIDGGEERVVIVAEWVADGADQDETLRAVRLAILNDHGLAPSIALIKPGSIDKTSSGKLSRQACKDRFSHKRLHLLASSHEVAADGALSDNESGPSPVIQDIVDGLIVELGLVLGVEAVKGLSAETRLADLNVDSLSIMDLAGRLEERFGVRIPVTPMLEDITLQGLAATFQAQVEGRGGLPSPSDADGRRSVVLSKPVDIAPIFCVGGLGGAAQYLRELAEAFESSRHFVALQPPGLFPGEVPVGSVEELAGLFVDELRRLQHGGAYLLAGHSFGGVVALEMARQLFSMGCEVGNVFLLDTVRIEQDGDNEGDAIDRRKAIYEVRNVLRRSGGGVRDPEACESFLTSAADRQDDDLRTAVGNSAIVPSGASFDRIVEVYRRSYGAMVSYKPSFYRGSVTLLRAKDPFPRESLHPGRSVNACFDDDALGWGPYCMDLDIMTVPGDHFSLVLGENARSLASIMQGVASGGRRGGGNPVPAREHSPSTGRVLEIDDGKVRFDPFHPAFAANPHPVLRQMLGNAPVHKDVTGTWWIFKHADVSTCLRDKRLSADLRSVSDAGRPRVDMEGAGLKPSLASGWVRRQEELPLARFYNNVMLFVDNPQHARLRKAFSPAFTPESMARWESVVQRRVDRLVCDMLAKDRPDIVRDVALPLPVGVVMDILDVDSRDGDMIREWAHEVFIGLDPLLPQSRAERIIAAEDRLRTYVAGHVRKWKGRGDGSFMGTLAELESSGALSLDEVVSNCVFFFAAAFETTTAGIGNAMAALFDHPQQWVLLRSQPDLVADAVDEFLRFDAPLKLVPRVAMTDLAIGGTCVPKGSAVMLCLSSANRDPDVFSNPDVLDIRRDARKQVAFSHGPHYCIGAPLARVEMICALSALVRLDMRPVPGGAIRRDSKIFHGLDELRIAWCP